MRIGYVVSDAQGGSDRLMAEVAARLAAEGLRPFGAVQRSLERPARAMLLRLLPDGPEIRITQDLGPMAAGCRLDPGALEEAVALAGARLPAGEGRGVLPGVLVVNRFGKQEAMGRGFAPLIAEAMSRGMPVLAGVAVRFETAFAAFAGDLAEPLPGEARAITRWCRARCPAALRAAHPAGDPVGGAGG